MTRVAVMQPYFVPYAGYFRLFAATDLVAVFDCVQFPRRGWVHRNRLPNAQGEPSWLTLPLKKAPFTARIADLEFTDKSVEIMQERCQKFPQLQGDDDPLLTSVMAATGDVVGYLMETMAGACRQLDLKCTFVRTSSLALDPELTGTDRVIAAARAVGGDVYVNLEGGAALYDPAAFRAHELELKILPPWQGSNWSILHRLRTEPSAAIRSEIVAQL